MSTSAPEKSPKAITLVTQCDVLKGYKDVPKMTDVQSESITPNIARPTPIAFGDASAKKNRIQTPIDGSGVPFSPQELNHEMSQYLDACIQRMEHAQNTSPTQCIIAFDVDGTFNYRYSGYGMAGAKMSFFGGKETAEKLLKLQEMGATFVALTGAPEGVVRTLTENTWMKQIETDPTKQDLKALQEPLKALFKSFTVIKCDPTDTKGEMLWEFTKNKIDNNTQTLLIEFLDDSVKNAGGLVPSQIAEKFKSEGNTTLEGKKLKIIDVHSTWLATGIGDFNEKQQAYAATGGDYAYSPATAMDREACINGKKENYSVTPGLVSPKPEI